VAELLWLSRYWPSIIPLLIVPEHLRAKAALMQTVRKRRLGMIPPTPGGERKRFNATVATPTPSKHLRLTPSSTSNRMNSTFANSVEQHRFLRPPTSASSSHCSSLETIADTSDESIASDMSSIKAAGAYSNASLNQREGMNASCALDVSQLRSVFSPMMKQLREDIAQHINQQFEQTVLASAIKTQSE